MEANEQRPLARGSSEGWDILNPGRTSNTDRPGPTRLLPFWTAYAIGAADRVQHVNGLHQLTTDDANLTIPSNVTMAIQGSAGPEEAGLYATVDNPYLYFVCPGTSALKQSVHQANAP